MAAGRFMQSEKISKKTWTLLFLKGLRKCHTLVKVNSTYFPAREGADITLLNDIVKYINYLRLPPYCTIYLYS